MTNEGNGAEDGAKCTSAARNHNKLVPVFLGTSRPHPGQNVFPMVRLRRHKSLWCLFGNGPQADDSENGLETTSRFIGKNA